MWLEQWHQWLDTDGCQDCAGLVLCQHWTSNPSSTPSRVKQAAFWFLIFFFFLTEIPHIYRKCRNPKGAGGSVFQLNTPITSTRVNRVSPAPQKPPSNLPKIFTTTPWTSNAASFSPFFGLFTLMESYSVSSFLPGFLRYHHVGEIRPC